MKKFIISVSALVLLFSACKKDDEPTRRDHLTSGGWRVNQFNLNLGPLGQQDLLAMQEDCQKDNLLSFLNDQTLSSDEGPTKCDPSDPQVTNAGNWNLNSGDAKLSISYSLTGGLSGNFTIDKLDASSLQLHLDTTLTQGGFPLTASVQLGFVKN